MNKKYIDNVSTIKKAIKTILVLVIFIRNGFGDQNLNPGQG